MANEVAEHSPQKLRWTGILMVAGTLLCLHPAVGSATALIAGVVLGLCGGNPHVRRTQRVAHYFLQISVVGLGAGMNLVTVAHAGLDGLGITFLSIAATLGVGLWLGKMMGVSSDLSILLSGGTAICGGSAIAALTGTLRPKAHDTTVALATVFLLNGIALIIFPPIGHWLGLSQSQFAWWAALGIHDTSSVTGAGLAYGREALDLALVIKLARALWIVPLVFFVARFIRHAPKADVAPRKMRLPWFIVGFILMAAIFTWLPGGVSAGHGVAWVSQRLLVATLFLIGAGFTRQALRHVGFKPLLLAVILWVLVAGISLLVILRA